MINFIENSFKENGIDRPQDKPHYYSLTVLN